MSEEKRRNPIVKLLGFHDYVTKKTETLDLPPNDIHFVEGDPFILLRNIGTRPGFTKGRGWRAIQIKTEE
jgi:hypothetical protein